MVSGMYLLLRAHATIKRLACLYPELLRQPEAGGKAACLGHACLELLGQVRLLAYWPQIRLHCPAYQRQGAEDSLIASQGLH